LSLGGAFTGRTDEKTLKKLETSKNLGERGMI
jgi:hypothetical protein